MKMKKIGLIALLTFIIDRILKVIVSSKLVLYKKYEIINKFFYLYSCKNKGAAFSIFSGNVLFLITVTFIAFILILKYIKENYHKTKLENIAYGLLLGGVIGNLFDRIFYGYVIDFISFIIFNYNFPVFNIADISIVISVFLLIVCEFRKGENNE